MLAFLPSALASANSMSLIANKWDQHGHGCDDTLLRLFDKLACKYSAAGQSTLAKLQLFRRKHVDILYDFDEHIAKLRHTVGKSPCAPSLNRSPGSCTYNDSIVGGERDASPGKKNSRKSKERGARR